MCFLYSSETNVQTTVSEPETQDDDTDCSNNSLLQLQDDDNVSLASSKSDTSFSDAVGTQRAAPDAQTAPRPKVARQRKREADVSDRELLQAIMQSDTKQQGDDLDYFGQSVAHTMRRFTKKQQAVAKVKINQVLFEVEFDETLSTGNVSGLAQPAASTVQMEITDASILSRAMTECGIPIVE